MGAAAAAAFFTTGRAAWAQAKQVAGYNSALLPGPDQLGAWLKTLHDFGPIRIAGTAPARAYEEFLAAAFANLGCAVKRDQFRLMTWEGDIEKCSITVTEDSGAKRNLEVLAYFPFGGSTTGMPPAEGKLLWGGEGEKCGPGILNKYTAAELADAIVVVDMPLKTGGIRGPTVYYPGSVPDPLPLISTAPQVKAQGGHGPMNALDGKCKGLILCYSDISDDAARNNYLPFSGPHRKTPGLWVGAASTQYLRGVAGKARASIRCDARLTPNARADALLCTLPGMSDEVIYLTTHTDGPNEINDDGGLGLLAIATYLSKIPRAQRRRTVVFNLQTCHYALGAVADPVTGSGVTIEKLMARNADVMKRIVAHIAMEQLGGLDWQDEGGKWSYTGMPAPEYWLPTPPREKLPNGSFDRRVTEASMTLFRAAIAGQDPRYARSGLIRNPDPGDPTPTAIGPGEGGGLRAAGIPGIGLMGVPQYFFTADPKGVISKMDARVMYNAVSIAAKMVVLMDRLSVDQLNGRAPITERDLFGA